MITKMLETERTLYKQLMEALIICEKGRLSTKTESPTTTTPTTTTRTTTPTPQTTIKATTKKGEDILLVLNP